MALTDRLYTLVRRPLKKADHSQGDGTDVSSEEATELLKASDTELGRLFFAHRGRIMQKWVHYLGLYDAYLAPFRGRPVRILEIGVNRGGSLQLWREYF